MATKRRRFTAEFKARVAMEALRGDRPVQEIAAKHEVHPDQISGWKRQAQGGLREVTIVVETAAACWMSLGASRGYGRCRMVERRGSCPREMMQ